MTIASPLDTLWYTRCPVRPERAREFAGLVVRHGDDAGLRFGILQDADAELAGRHFDHGLPSLIGRAATCPRSRRGPRVHRPGSSD